MFKGYEHKPVSIVAAKKIFTKISLFSHFCFYFGHVSTQIYVFLSVRYKDSSGLEGRNNVRRWQQKGMNASI